MVKGFTAINPNSKFSQGVYTPKNPQKYRGTEPPLYRSAWELTLMTVLDLNPAVISWISEPMRIPYVNPLTGRISSYIPDFLVSWVDRYNKQRTELIEIKPLNQSIRMAKTKRDKIEALKNEAKWNAAREFCAKNGLIFRILSERDLFKY